MKICKRCKEEKDSDSFYNSPNNKGGKRSECKKCVIERSNLWKENNPDKHRKHSYNWRLDHEDYYKEKRKEWKAENRSKATSQERKRKAIKKNAMASWADEELIDLIYDECPQGCHVDHIIPLSNPKVCGLHVQENLQYLPQALNNIKYNKFNDEVLSFRRY